MKTKKRKALEAAGWKVGTVQEFLGLTDAEAAYIELRLSLSKLLRSFRAKKSLTQVQVARLIGSSQSRVAKMEAGDSTVSLDLLIRAILASGASTKDIARVLAGKKQKAA